jgi:mono/diheme cytochrome c family protein
MDPKHSIGPDRIDYKETPGDLTEVHAAIERENPEPTAEVTPIPLWLTAVCGFAIACAGMYLGLFHGGFRGDVFNERMSSPSLLFPAVSKTKGGGAAEAVQSLAAQGKSVYANCQPCHQANGNGLPGQFPPLAKSEWVTGSEKRLVAIILKGLQGPIKVEGATYNGAMPAWEKTLSDRKIAAVASYVRANFGNNAPEITEGKVAAARTEFAAKTDLFTEAQLLEIPADAILPDAGGPAPATANKAAPAPTTSPGTAPMPAQGGPATGTGAPVGTGSPSGAPASAAAAAPAGAATTGAAGLNVPKLMALGKMQYNMICVACHQANGMGLPMVFPPLAKTEYVNGSPERFAAMILKGNVGPITVDGKLFNNVMPPQEAMLTDEKVAAVMTYVRASFGNNSPPVAPEVVTAARKKFTDRKTMWTEPELKAWKD